MIAIINYKMGNLRSVRKAFQRIGEEVIITDSPKVLEKADKLILPGVGHFKKGMENLKELGLIEVLNDLVLNQKKPILGICLGMQLLTQHSEEGNVEGLNWIAAKTLKFPSFAKDTGLRIPHIGWNTLNMETVNPIYQNLSADAAFYFVHSYYVASTTKADIAATTQYGIDFVSSVHKDNIYGTQFHPEKSHDYGLHLLKNFCSL